MNEELIQQIVSRILSEPAFQALLHGNPAGTQVLKVVKPEGIVLLNYVPEFEQVLNVVKQRFGAEYTLSILPSEQALVTKPKLPEGMTWLTPQDALSKTTWQTIIVPACSPNTLAKAALGIRDNPISEILGRGISQGIRTMLGTEYLGFTEHTPKAYQELYAGYLQTVQSYGVLVSTTIGDDCTLPKDNRTSLFTQTPTVKESDRTQGPSLQGQRLARCDQKDIPNEQKTPLRAEIRFEKKFFGDKQVYGIPEGAVVLVKRGTVISPLARDTLKSRRIELRQEKEEGRR